MTTQPPNITTRFRETPGSMVYYTIMCTAVATTTYFAFLFTGIAGHIAIWPLLDAITLNNFSSNLGTVTLALFLGTLAWATPYVLAHFVAEPFHTSTTHNGLPKSQMWGIWAVIPAMITLAILWFSPLWATVSPGIGATIASTIPTGMGNNVLSFGFVTIPMAVAYTLFSHDDLQRSSTTKDTRIKTQISPTNSSRATDSSPSNTTDDSITAADLPGEITDVSEEDTTDQDTTESTSTHNSRKPLNEYTYNWQSPPDVSFSDVGGMESVKDELTREVISPLRGDTERYKEFGVSIPNLLFYGPPGTGKTYMAEALAGELAYPYIKLSASDITSKWINESGENINTLFSEAAQLGADYGYVVVFVDEIDALLADRGMDQQNAENKKVVDEFLNHLSDTGQQNTLFIGATNHFDTLDTAAIRTGRIDKKVHIGLPDLEARIGVFAAQLDDRPGDVPSKDKLKTLAEQLEGVSSADIGGIVDRAARRAVERNADSVELEDLAKEVQAEQPN